MKTNPERKARQAQSKRRPGTMTLAGGRSCLRPGRLLLFALASAVGLQPSALLHAASPLGTAFTYQGRLQDGGQPASGIYDLRFAICDLPSGGSPIAGPITNSPVALVNGLFTVTLDFGPGVFTGAARWLEIGVRTNGSAGDYTTLTPRQPLTPSPYALHAPRADSAATVTGPVAASQLTGTIASPNIGPGTITAPQLAAGAAFSNLYAGGQSGVASGGLVLSPNENRALINAGYVRPGTTLLTDSWQNRTQGDAPAARRYHTAVWTGTEMIVWGGYSGTAELATGGRYSPVADVWTATATNGAPDARAGHTAVWTGNEMIVWGGPGSSYYLDDTWSYTPGKTMYLYLRP